MRGRGRAAQGMVALLLAWLAAQGASAQPSEGVESTGGSDAELLDEIAFPGLPRGLLRIGLGSGLAPGAESDDSEISVAAPGGRISLQAPIGTRASARAFAAVGTQLYDVRHESALFEDCGACPAPDQFYAATLGVQGGLQLNDDWSLIYAQERWALLAEGFGKARWEDGAFERSLESGVILALGYELPRRLRIAAGVQVGVEFDGGEVSVSPTGTFRWDAMPWLRVRNRGLGLELELRAIRRLELFAAGYRNSDRFRLRSRAGLPSGAEFRDRRWQVGAGFEWKLWRWLRLAAEVGAIVDRELSIRASGEDDLDSVRVDPSPYVDLRLEFRP